MAFYNTLQADPFENATAFTCPAGIMGWAAAWTWPVWSLKKKSGSNSRRNSPLAKPPKNMASSTPMFQSIKAVTSAGAILRIFIKYVAAVAALQPVQRSQQRLERAIGQGLGGVFGFVALELEYQGPLAPLVDALGLVREQHGASHVK
ncbi:hypothetical protein FQA39_LY19237 [Lamprigera yunnana]|nr:hypothetical protein FQA39_LY19237 [Lamprigera yunnana]